MYYRKNDEVHKNYICVYNNYMYNIYNNNIYFI